MQSDFRSQHINNLSRHKDTKSALQSLASSDADIKTVIFSNGTHEMVTSALRSASIPFAAETPLVLASDPSIQVYKPASAIYRALLVHPAVQKGEAPGECWLVSSNPFDISGARSQGMNAVWVDREGKGWADMLPWGGSVRPTRIVRSLEEVAKAVQESTKEQHTTS